MPRPAKPVRLSRRAKERVAQRRRRPQRPQHLGVRPRRLRAARTFHIATASSTSPPAASTTTTRPVENSTLICASTASSRSLTLSKSSWRVLPVGRRAVGRPIGRDDPRGRSRLMCAFIPASANWMDRMPRRRRHSNSGRHADGAARGIGIARGDRVEIQIRKHDVEPSREMPDRGTWSSSPRRAPRASPQVQPIEPPQPIASGTTRARAPS